MLHLDDWIITDAGCELIAFDEAVKFFTVEDIQDWWRETIAPEEWGIDFNALKDAGIDIDENDDDAVIDFLNNYDWIPKSVEVVTGKVVFQEFKWVQVLALAYPVSSLKASRFAAHELGAILLGNKMKEEMRLSEPIANDCKDAVATAKKQGVGAVWKRRKLTKIAHDTRLQHARSIFRPDGTKLC